MKLVCRAVAVGAVAALTLGTPTAAFAGGSGHTKGKTTSAQKQSNKAAEARKKAEERRKKADAKRRLTFPGTVTAVSGNSVTITRKHRGVSVAQMFSVTERADVKRDGVRNALPQVGDRAVAQAVRKDGQLVVVKLRSSAPEVEAAPAPAGPVIAPGTVPTKPTHEEAPKAADGSVVI